MGKVEVNNEIVRMRQFVRQARVCVIHKLTREAKTMRRKNGTEQLQEKSKRKADKLIGEIYALKKIKDDSIIKFGITNKKSLREILQSKTDNQSIRVMARVADYKSLKNAIIQFKETYPDYEQYLQPGKKKRERKKCTFWKEDSETKDKRVTRAGSRNLPSKSTERSSMDESSFDECTDKGSNEIGLNERESEHSEVEDNLESRSRIKPAVCVQTEDKGNKRLRKKKKESVESMEEDDGDTRDKEEAKENVKKARIEEDKERAVIKVINKQATVKRFTELLQEKTLEEDVPSNEKDGTSSTENKPESEKKIDSFFMSGDGDAYLSIASSKAEENEDLLENEDNVYKNDKSKRYSNKRFTNDRFFGNVKSIDGRSRNKGPLGKQRRNSNASAFKNTEKESLHPSWAAKRKQQEMIKQGFQGKKIVFDDE